MGFRSPYYFTIKFADPSLHVRELADPSLHVRELADPSLHVRELADPLLHVRELADPSLHVREYQRLLFLYQILREVKSKIIVSVSKVRLYSPYYLYLCIGEDSYP